MIKRSHVLCVAVLLQLLAGCSGVPSQPSASPAQSAAIPDVLLPSSGEGGGVGAEQVPKPVISGNHAVLALLDRARIDIGVGQRESAGASLERALRIEPRNAWLWQELAQLRLSQGQYAQAISLAKKSISFAGRERRLLVLDWRVIGNARVAEGKPAEAEAAFNRATELEQAAQAEENHGF